MKNGFPTPSIFLPVTIAILTITAENLRKMGFLPIVKHAILWKTVSIIVYILLEQHQTTAFPLEGAHIATPCFACHVSEDKKMDIQEFRGRCVDCHQDIHEGYISENYYPKDDCTVCHANDAWTTVDL